MCVRSVSPSERACGALSAGSDLGARPQFRLTAGVGTRPCRQSMASSEWGPASESSKVALRVLCVLCLLVDTSCAHGCQLSFLI